MGLGETDRLKNRSLNVYVWRHFALGALLSFPAWACLTSC